MKKFFKASISISLRVRVLLTLVALVATTIGGGLVTIWYAESINSLFTSVIDRNVASFQMAEELETVLVMQKGFTTYYFQDGDTNWLRQLEQYQKTFEEKLKKAREYARMEAAWGILNKIEAEYFQYREARGQVIRFYQTGERESGIRLHRKIRHQFLCIYNLCEQYKEVHRKSIVSARQEAQSRTQFITALALISLQIVTMMGLLLAYILFKQILGPIRKLTMETDSADSKTPLSDEVRTLSHRVHSLIEDVDQTQNKLARSQEHLVQSEKWAMIGKLAAGVAHSIRNPLTSVKIRLFSMSRAIDLSPTQKEDFEVISGEIRHMESIVRNFLEFSRPPKLKMQRTSPSDVVDMALRLLHHRLESYGVKVELNREKRLKEVLADPDQLKEVLVNLLVNVCEAMVGGGLVRIYEEERKGETRNRLITITISDSGPGVPESIQESIFQPFFSTKEEGTGLGLSIAARIMEEHGGRLTLKSQEGKGATFIITLPVEEYNP